MKIHRIDHVGVIVNDLTAAKAFFLNFGLEMLGEAEVEGEWVERIIGLNDVRATFNVRDARWSGNIGVDQIPYTVR